jgi:hypothetical protein
MVLDCPKSAQGKHPKYSQRQLGHSSINLTMDIYRHLMETVNHEPGGKLGRTALGENKDSPRGRDKIF